ncbi:hypothetical protein MY04_1535 [Flammeovirga sp. MY04]|uniref:hypothetical protein n=1 Tax=Flammeovirga sp. MY04 TaxID=1191459 RepID=UPI00080620ED|nr:hypothetical protein [Flammeovirga sp. MY04]ANQ48911.1 hypothetical protein MY04_1535 [Flammeovirga sp. MY04]
MKVIKDNRTIELNEKLKNEIFTKKFLTNEAYFPDKILNNNDYYLFISFEFDFCDEFEFLFKNMIDKHKESRFFMSTMSPMELYDFELEYEVDLKNNKIEDLIYSDLELFKSEPDFYISHTDIGTVVLIYDLSKDFVILIDCDSNVIYIMINKNYYISNDIEIPNTFHSINDDIFRDDFSKEYHQDLLRNYL